MTTSNTLALRKGWFDGLVVIDSNCDEFPIVQVERRGGMGPFWGWRIVEPRRVRIEIFYGEPRQLTLDEAKQRVFEAVDMDWQTWDSTEFGLAGLKDRIRGAVTCDEMIALLL